MKKSLVCLFLLFVGATLCVSTLEAKAASGTVVLIPKGEFKADVVHYMLGGTTRCSGEQSVIYIDAQRWGLQSVGDPYTFKSELHFSFAFYDDGGGRGKILNVSDSEHEVEYTCYDMSGVAVYTESVVIKPRTISRIMVRGDAYYKHLSKVVCEIKY